MALGQEPADLVLTACRVLNVYTGQLLPAGQVGVAGEYIAYVGGEERPLGPNTKVIDGQGQILVPGFIDAHAHLDEMVASPPGYLEAVVRGGTTTLVTDAMEVANAMGADGVNWFLEAVRDQPTRVFLLVPTMVPGNPRLLPGRRLEPAAVAALLDLAEVVGLGEVYWKRVVADDPELDSLFALAREKRKVIEGHGAGARGARLAALAVSGAGACHEAIKVEEVMERLSCGLFTILREGSIRRDLEALAPLARESMDFRHLGLGSDGIDPADLLAQGAMEYVVQKAIDLGFPPVTAIQMATINNATHFGLDHVLGAVAPGRYADLVLLPRLEEIRATCVIKGGTPVAAPGYPPVRARPYLFPRAAREKLDFRWRLAPADLCLKASGTGEVTVQVVRLLDDMVTAWERVSLPVRHGLVRADGAVGLNLAFARSTLEPQEYTVALVRGWQLRAGACASSATWDAPHVVGVGASAAELAFAANRVAELGGGVAVVRGQEVLAELALPVGGIISEEPLETVAAKMEATNRAIRGLGYPHPNPFLALRVMGFVGVPRLRLTARGLVDTKNQTLVPVITT